MTRVLALCSPADPTGSVKQFDLALPSLRERFEVLRHTTPADVPGLLASVQPALVHTLGANAFRAVRRVSVAAFARQQAFPKWLAAGAADVEPTLGLAPGVTATFSQTEHERDWAARLSPAPMQFSGMHAVERTPHPPGAVRSTAPGGCGVLSKPFILAAGGFDAVANLKQVVWAFDALHYAHPTLQLVLLGDGPLRPQVEHYARSLGLNEHAVKFVGFQQDVSPYLHSASQVWCTHTRGGAKFLLEAMAAGVPVIAADTPDVRTVVTPGATGELVPAGRPVEVAKVAHQLLTNPVRREALSVAGQAAVSRHPVADLAEALVGAYDTLTWSASPRLE
jgi:glycosyltransferase involved in cell wall biosynthesis